jgi:competence protein ComGC
MRQRVGESSGSESGSTLLGLCRGILVIGVSVAIALAAIPGFQDWRRESACRADKQRAEIAVQAYHVLSGNTAESIDQLVSEDFLKESLPTTNGYSITVATGVVTASGACT